MREHRTKAITVLKQREGIIHKITNGKDLHYGCDMCGKIVEIECPICGSPYCKECWEEHAKVIKGIEVCGGCDYNHHTKNKTERFRITNKVVRKVKRGEFL